MSELTVGTLSGLAANSYVIDVASGSSLDLRNGATLPAGSIVQVVSTTKTNTFTTSSTSFVDITDLSASITPSSTANKVLVQVVLPLTGDSNVQAVMTTITDSSNNVIFTPDSIGSREAVMSKWLIADNQNNGMTTQSFQFLHSPSTTSSFTYKARMRVTGGNGYLNRDASDADAANNPRGIATIVLMEVAG